MSVEGNGVVKLLLPRRTVWLIERTSTQPHAEWALGGGVRGPSLDPAA